MNRLSVFLMIMLIIGVLTIRVCKVFGMNITLLLCLYTNNYSMLHFSTNTSTSAQH